MLALVTLCSSRLRLASSAGSVQEQTHGHKWGFWGSACVCICVCAIFYYKQGWQLCLFQVAGHFPLQNLISSWQNLTIQSETVQVNSSPQIQKIVRGMCLFLWSYQASPFSGSPKVKDTNISLYKQYTSFPTLKNTVLWWQLIAFTVAGMTASLAGILVTASLGEYSFSDKVSKSAWDLSQHLRNCSLPCNCNFVCCCCSRMKEHELVVGCSLVSWLTGLQTVLLSKLMCLTPTLQVLRTCLTRHHAFTRHTP